MEGDDILYNIGRMDFLTNGIGWSIKAYVLNVDTSRLLVTTHNHM